MIVYELNTATSTGSAALFLTIEGAKARAQEVLDDWRTSDWANDPNEGYALPESLTWAMARDPKFRRSTREVLSARYDHVELWAFTINEREVFP